MNIALKYRPDNFKDLIGQDVLVRIFKNAFFLKKFPQSVLLSGNSGVGKTTIARIIALCLNCSLGPTFEPCGLCKNCITIKNSSHPDVIEIDAASHTSVEDIKIILGNICYLPIKSKFKVIIIDEVHMLSSSAFNALLKTLEEPPSNVNFILATTEIKKIPITVTVRCQRFDLYNISESKIVDRLNYISQKENYFVENGVLELIACHSNNSMRNALFLMNQVILYSKNGLISVNNVVKVLGLADKNTIFNLLNTILDGNLHDATLIFEKSIKISSPISIFEGILQIIQLICRYLIVKEVNSNLFTEYECNKIKDLSLRKPLIFFFRLWKLLIKEIYDVKNSICNNISFELILVSLCYFSDSTSSEEVSLITKDFNNDVENIYN